MPHGFLNYDFPNGIPQAKICIKQAANYMKELLNLNEI